MEPITPLLILHSFGLAMGLGGVTLFDLLLLRSIRRPLDPANVCIFDTVSKLAALALGLLWLSGLGFLILYQWTNPALLGNPKLWAKIAIVGILTANGVYLHARVLPILHAQANRRRTLFEGLPPRVRVGMLTAGAVSGVSWYFPFVLGIVRELNFAASTAVFLAAYAVVVAVACLIAQLAGSVLSARAAVRDDELAISPMVLVAEHPAPT